MGNAHLVQDLVRMGRRCNADIYNRSRFVGKPGLSSLLKLIALNILIPLTRLGEYKVESEATKQCKVH